MATLPWCTIQSQAATPIPIPKSQFQATCCGLATARSANLRSCDFETCHWIVYILRLVWATLQGPGSKSTGRTWRNRNVTDWCHQSDDGDVTRWRRAQQNLTLRQGAKSPPSPVGPRSRLSVTRSGEFSPFWLLLSANGEKIIGEFPIKKWGILLLVDYAQNLIVNDTF